MWWWLYLGVIHVLASIGAILLLWLAVIYFFADEAEWEQPSDPI